MVKVPSVFSFAFLKSGPDSFLLVTSLNFTTPMARNEEGDVLDTVDNAFWERVSLGWLLVVLPVCL